MTLSVNDGHSKKLGGYKLDIHLCIIMDKNWYDRKYWIAI